MAYVINTSRVYNAVGVSGNARRALLTAQTYAQYRTAFGQQVIRFPLVQDILANMRADTAAMLSGTLHIARLMDELETAATGGGAADFLRLAINLNKYRTAVLGHEVIMRAIELLGGNGAIETFSVLPRLLRDNVVYENWEGTHNVLLAQVQRDMRRYGLQEAFFQGVRGLFEGTRDAELREAGIEHLDQIEAELAEVLGMDELTAAIYFRPLMDRLTDLYYVACLGVEGSWELDEKQDRAMLRLASLFLKRRVAGLEPKDIPYYDDLVSRLCQ
jgi:hypothetical protein